MSGGPLTFDPALWRPYYLFLSHISEFLDDIGVDCAKVDPGAPPIGYPKSDIDAVLAKRRSLDDDPDRRARIIDQDQNFPDFLKPFGLSYTVAQDRYPWVHAATNKIPIELARPVLLKVKTDYNAARPWQLAPNMVTVVPNPGHPSYPSGHTCQTLLAVEMIKLVLPPRLLTATAVKAIEDLAADTAINREYAGLHYASDTAGGRRLALNMMPFITKHFADVIAGAQNEALTI